MTTKEKEIDLSMFSFFVNDASQHMRHLENLSDELDNRTSPDQGVVTSAIDALKAINSGSRLCGLPDVPDLTMHLTDEIVQISQSEDSHHLAVLKDSIYSRITLLNDLISVQPDNLAEWMEEHSTLLTKPTTVLTDLPDLEKTQKPDPQPEPSVNTIDTGMLELFKLESETQANVINENLLKLENDPGNNSIIEPLMRAAHSIKGAARMIGLNIIVDLAHLMEECFVNTQNGSVTLKRDFIDLLLHCNDILSTIPKLDTPDIPDWLDSNSNKIKACLPLLESVARNEDIDIHLPDSFSKNDIPPETRNDIPASSFNKDHQDNSIRIKSTQLNKMLAISNELLVSQNWLQEHLNSLQHLKKIQTGLALSFQKLRQQLDDIEVPDDIFSMLLETENAIDQCRSSLAEDINQVDEFDRKSLVLSSRLNQEVTACRMRSFRECTVGFERMVRDVSHELEKKIILDIDGLDTLVDSDILDNIEAPLTHLLRNAIDHGIEHPDKRIRSGKPESGHIKLHAYHNAGKLNINITDDGQGINFEKLRHTIVSKGLTNKDMVNNLTENELLDFLFLPGFSTKEDVTEISGRGVGLDIVHSVITNLRGIIRSKSKPGHGMSITIQLPLTLSVIHALMTKINNDYYAFPLARIHTVIKTPCESLFTVEQKQFIKYNNLNISVIHLAQVLGFSSYEHTETTHYNIVILFDRGEYYALVVDELIGEEKLALHQISHLLGKIQDISASAIADNGQVILVLDIDDILINIQETISDNQLQNINTNSTSSSVINAKKVLVIDDSLTVREVEKNLLASKGYDVDIAIDGVDGWNTIRQNDYDLIITDIDMPRMNGIELVLQIKSEPRFESIPVMIVSYKDNPDDRQRGLEAGADYYLTKGSFHDDTLIEAVMDLIGEAI